MVDSCIPLSDARGTQNRVPPQPAPATRRLRPSLAADTRTDLPLTAAYAHDLLWNTDRLFGRRQRAGLKQSVVRASSARPKHLGASTHVCTCLCPPPRMACCCKPGGCVCFERTVGGVAPMIFSMVANGAYFLLFVVAAGAYMQCLSFDPG
jgi:hypothetical protein